MSMNDLNAEMTLRRYIYDYMVRKSFHTSAEIFKGEAIVPTGPVAINDSQWGFLLEWWLIFWDTYIARQSTRGIQQSSNEASSVYPSSQKYYNSQSMETGLNGKKAWIGNQLLQTTGNSQRGSSNFADNIFHHNYSITNCQQIKTGSQPTNQLFRLQRNWVKQSNFLRCGLQDLPPMNAKRDVPGADIQNPQSMDFGHLSLNGSHPRDQNATTPKLKIPTFGFPHTASGINLSADMNPPRGGPSSETGTTSMNMGTTGLNPWFISQDEWENLQRLRQQQDQQYPVQGLPPPSFESHIQSQTANRSAQIPPFVQMDKLKAEPSQHQNQHYPAQGFPNPSFGDSTQSQTANRSAQIPPFVQMDKQELAESSQQQYSVQRFPVPSFGNHSLSQTVNRSAKIPSFVQMDKQKLVEAIENENSRKRKEPSYSGNEGKKFAGLSNLTNFSLASPLKEELASKTLIESCGGAIQPETSKGLDLSGEAVQPETSELVDKSGHMKEGIGMENADFLPTSTEDAKDEVPLKDATSEDHGGIHSSTAQQDSLQENTDNNDDQNKLNGRVSEADVSLNEDNQAEKPEIHLFTREVGTENNGIAHSTIPPLDISDGCEEKVEDQNKLNGWASEADVSLNEGGQTEKSEVHLFTGEAGAEKNVMVPQNIPQKDNSNGSEAEVEDQNKLNGWVSETDVLLNECVQPEKSEIHLSTRESEAKNNGIVLTTVPQQDSSDGSTEKAKDS